MFQDSFEWDISNADNEPDSFAQQLVNDLGLEPAMDYSIAVAYEIRKQTQLFICQKIQGFCNVYENYLQIEYEGVQAAKSAPGAAESENNNPFD